MRVVHLNLEYEEPQKQLATFLTRKWRRRGWLGDAAQPTAERKHNVTLAKDGVAEVSEDGAKAK